jgi:hypothetical protein
VLALHFAFAPPFVALAVWFGVIDQLPFGEGRCTSCGVEGYVIAAHLGAALWLGVLVAWAAAARRQLRESIAAPGRVTLAVLGGVGAFVVLSLIWHPVFTAPAFVAMILSVGLFPAAVIWWVLGVVFLTRSPPHSDGDLERRMTGQLTAAWVSLTLLLPAVFAWVWVDRVEWLVF